jgi:tryptophan synthase alpha chain
MTRIEMAFRSGRKLLIGYLTAGDPSAARTVEHVHALARGGVDLIELGVPFSDPIADGPVIQAAAERALTAGTTLAGVLDMAREIRRRSEIPLLLFSYMNPAVRFGFARLAAEAKEAGIDGCLMTDLSVEEADNYVRVMRGAGREVLDRFHLLRVPRGCDRRAGSAFGFGSRPHRPDPATHGPPARPRVRDLEAGAGPGSGQPRGWRCRRQRDHANGRGGRGS